MGAAYACFYDCMITIEGRTEYYRQTYGVMPAFKAGMHLEGATVGEDWEHQEGNRLLW